MQKKGLTTIEINQRIQENKVNGESKKIFLHILIF